MDEGGRWQGRYSYVDAGISRCGANASAGATASAASACLLLYVLLSKTYGSNVSDSHSARLTTLLLVALVGEGNTNRPERYREGSGGSIFGSNFRSVSVTVQFFILTLTSVVRNFPVLFC